MKNKIIILTGPTGVGKSSASIELAKSISGEIISCDSFQIYKGMDIGTGKIKKSEMQGIPHHNLDIIYPDEEFNVALFKRTTEELIESIIEKGRVPILEGGTGLYIHSLLYNLEFEGEESDKKIRERLEMEAETNGLEAMYDKLLKIDPDSPKYINSGNRHRIIRALEVYELTGKTPSDTLKNFREKRKKYNFLYFVINDDRQILYDRINKRVDAMVEEGLKSEIDNLLSKGYDFDLRSFKAIGYKEFRDYYEGLSSLDLVYDKIKQHSRNYAKRQITWFKREEDAIWLDKSLYSNEDEFTKDLIFKSKEFIENE